MLESLALAYGYWVILIGTFLEGETVLLIGGFLAHRGYLHLRWVICAASAGSFLGDQLYFAIGRWKGGAVLARRPDWRARKERVDRLLDRYHVWVIFGFRFLYGLRTIVPFVLGASSVPFLRFLLLNLAGAIVWSVAIGLGGYFFGHALEAFFGDLKRIEMGVVCVVAALGSSVWAVHWYRGRSQP